MCSCRRTRSEDCASSPGRYFSANLSFLNLKPLSRSVVSNHQYLVNITVTWSVFYPNEGCVEPEVEIICLLQVTSMGNIMTYWGCLSMGASLLRATTYFWETMWTEGSSLWRPSVCFWPTKSNTRRTSSCWGETMSAPPSTEYMDSMMSVSDVWGCWNNYSPALWQSTAFVST